MRILAAVVLLLIAGLPARAADDDGSRAAAFERALAQARTGDVQAQVAVAEMYFLGRGVGQDQVAAAAWFEVAAEAGHRGAQLNLARIHIQRDRPEKAVPWLRKAAEHGDADAMTSLGALYLRGLGVTRDGKAGVEWFSKAAALGDPQTQVELAMILIQGIGGEKDPKRGLARLRRAGLQGYGDALRRLAILYSQEEPVGKDLVETYRWLYQASLMGDEDATAALSHTAANMTRAQIAEAKRRAEEWKPGLR